MPRDLWPARSFRGHPCGGPLNRALEDRVRAALPFLALGALVLIAYGRTLTFGYSHDDFFLLRPVAEWRFIGPSPTGFFWRPVWALVLALEYELFGLHPGPQHAISVLVQFVNASLMFALLGRLGVQRRVALATAALWTLLATTATGVAWLSGIDDALTMTGLMLATYFWVRRPAGPSIGDAVVATLWWLFAVLFKEVGLGWPFAMVAFAWWRRRRAPGAPRFGVELLLPLLAFGLYVALRVQALGHTAGLTSSDIPEGEMHLHGSPLVMAAGRTIHFCEALVYNLLPVDFFTTWTGVVVGWVIGLLLVVTLVVAWRAERPQRPAWLLHGAGWLVLFSLHGAMSPAPRTLYVPAAGLAFVLCEWVATSSYFRRSLASALVLFAFLGMQLVLERNALDAQHWQHFSNRVRNSTLLLGDDPRITPEKKAYLAKRYQFDDVQRLARFTRAQEMSLPWREYLQHLFKRAAG